MDFQLTKEQKDIQRAARGFAIGEFDEDQALEFDAEEKFPDEIWRKACELGFVGLHFPEALGGGDYGILENCLIVEEFCRKDSGIGIAIALSDFGSEIILRQGNEAQKEKFLSPITEGRAISTLAFMEEERSLTSLLTTAVKTESGYLINGLKSFVVYGELADFAIIICQSDTTKPECQISIILEMDTEGIEVFSMGEKVGMRMVPVSRISLKDVEVLEKNRLGDEEKGHLYLREFLDQMRIEAAAMAVGIAQGGLDMALTYAKNREQFGKAIAAFPAIRNKLADMYVELELARLLTYKVAWKFDHGKADSSLAAMAKMVASRTAYQVTYEALQIFGGYGYMTETHIEHFYRDAKALDLFIESGQIQREFIGNQIIGPRVTN